MSDGDLPEDKAELEGKHLARTSLTLADYFALKSEITLEQASEYLKRIIQQARLQVNLAGEEGPHQELIKRYLQMTPAKDEITLGMIMEFRAHLRYLDAMYMLDRRKGRISDELRSILAPETMPRTKDDKRWAGIAKDINK
jgi:hypothetical protein